ncbi:ubiquitin-protein ligase E3 component N-recognin-1 (N-end-recognizing protein) [Scheffersomyces xylosifermentans]|uniref:ubiquitin-protein ligase E3 component N-recognin-1 (N-end-recognizing protein) n=1 Tax=Scheffersomyces xylosifermentans TaxID=1304137 RepID=UPI00315DC7DE
MKSNKLKRFLVSLPAELDFINSVAVRQNVFSALYYAATDEGKYLSTLFPNLSAQEIAALSNWNFPLASTDEKKLFYSYKKRNAVYTHPKDKVCSRLLGAHEPVYRCEECGFDDTCVLCFHCFNKDDHKDHNVTMVVSSGESGGMCDCGDPEAFIKPLNCKCQQKIATSDAMNSAIARIESPLHDTIGIALDYILEVLNFSVQTLPFIHDHVNRDGINLTSEMISNASSLSNGWYSSDASDENSSDLWYLLLWNDECHNVDEAKSAIRAATGASDEKAGRVANEIDSNGRCILVEAKEPNKLLRAKHVVERGGLVASIVSARDYLREVIVESIISWLKDITQFTNNSEFADLSKAILSDHLLEPGFRFSKNFPQDFLCNLTVNKERRCFENGLLLDGEIINLTGNGVKEDIKISDLEKRAHLVLEPTNTTIDWEHSDDESPSDAIASSLQQMTTKSTTNSIARSRLQYLLLFEIRFTKPVRKMLPSILIPPVVADVDKKLIFSKQFIEIYPSLITISALSDREEDLNSLGDISSQILTCPKTVQNLIRTRQTVNVIGPVAQLIEEHSTRWNYDSGYPNFVDIAIANGDRKFHAIKKAVVRGIRDVGHLTDKELAAGTMETFFQKSELVMILLFLRNFQGYWPLQRKTGDHVETEVYDFVVHLEYSIPVLNIAKSIATSPVSKSAVLDAVSSITQYLMLRKLPMKFPGVADFHVSRQLVGFVNPINSLLSYLIQYHGIELFQPLLGSLSKPFMNISDISLRSIVLGAQVKIGFWIRNGISASRQASLYFDAILNDLTYLRDMHLNKIAALIDDPVTTLFNFLDRWELYDWYVNNESYDKTVYEDRFNTISEKFILFIYNIITDRTSFVDSSPEDKLLAKAEMSIAYALCDEPKAYSVLKSLVDSDISELPQFDDILYKCADYQAPTGLIDAGLYRLKPTMFEKLDPLSIFLDPSKFQVVSEALVRSIAKNKDIKEEKVVLVPEITECENNFVNENIARFTKTKEFAKLVYKYLQVALDTSDETYLPQLLHLIHAVLKDDELLHGQKYLNEHFINIPITDLLLTIVESTMSKHVVSKADFLVDQFVLKDQRVIDNLIDCFGEEYVKSYKRKKTDLFETDAEKKKRLAEERKSKIMKKFAKRREKFLDQNKEFKEGVAESMSATESTSELLLRTCVLCGEQESTSDPFGILVSTTETSTLWKLPDAVDKVHLKLAFSSWDEQSDISPRHSSNGKGGIYGTGYGYIDEFKTYLNKNNVTASVLSTCGHGMHYSCYRTASDNRKHYACPLCHNLHDLFLPTYIPPSSGGGFEADEVVKQPINSKYNKITSSSSVSKSRKIIEALVNEDYFNSADTDFRRFARILVDDLMESTYESKYLVGINSNEKFFNNLQNISVLIADTIRMNEIATRLEGVKSLSNFLQQIPGSVKTLLKSLIQCRAIIFECRSSPMLLGNQYDLSFEINSFWNSDQLLDGVFNEVVSLYFQTDESITTLARLGLAKLVTIVIYALTRRLNDQNSSQSFKDTLKVGEPGIVSQETREALVIILGGVTFDLGYDIDLMDVELLDSLYYSIERLALPYLRQIAIFEDVLTSKNLGENTHESIPNLLELEADILKQSRLDSTDALTQALHLPSLTELISSIAFEGHELDYNVYNIVLSAKIPKYISSGILTLDYPGVVKLIDLPDDYTDCITDVETYSVKGGYDRIICLACGSFLKNSRFAPHMSECSTHTNVFYLPRLNVLRICTHIGHNRISIEIPAPYLTVHGEIKKKRVGGKATLNKYRYQYLNKIWLNQGLYGFVTRNLFGTRQSFADLNINVGRDDDMDDDYDSDIFDEREEDEMVDEDPESFIW